MEWLLKLLKINLKYMLQVIKAKPNPSGKDRSPKFLTTQSRLGAEWIDIKNIGSGPASLKDIQIYHIAYKGDEYEWAIAKDFTNLLLPALGLPTGLTIRIHSGSGPVSILNPEDVSGANRHYFTGKGYIWNNDKIDKPMIYDKAKKVILDQTYYEPPITDGAILIRINDKLI